MREVVAGEGEDLLGGCGLALLQGHEGLGTLAPVRVRDPDDGALEHRGMGDDRLLHLDRGDVLAPRDDDVLAAVAQLDVPVRMPHGEVAGVEPAAVECRRRRLGVVEVAGHEDVAAHHDLAHRLAVTGDVTHLLVDDADEIGRGVRLALAREQPGPLGGRQQPPLRPLGAHGRRAVGLGQPVDVDHAEVQVVHAREQRGRGRRCGDHHGHLPLDAVRLRVVDDHQLHGRGAVEVGDALGVDQVPDQVRLDLADRQVPAGDRGDAPGEAPAVAVEHRLQPEEDGLGRQPGHESLVERVQVGAAIRVLHALRPARRARRVVDRDRLLLVFEPALRLLGRRRSEEILVRVSGGARVVDPDHVDAGEVERLDELGELRVEQERAGARVAQDVLDLGAREPRVDRDEDPAGGRNAEVRLQHRGAVGQERRDPVAFAQTGGAEPVGEAPGALAELGVRVAAIAVDDRALLRVHEGGTREQVDRVHLRAEDLGGRSSTIDRRALAEDQFHSPRIFIVEGTRTARTTVASIRTAIASPKPICCIMIRLRLAKRPKTATMMIAALVTVPAVRVMASRMASSVVAPASWSSLTRLRMKTW